MRYSAVDLNSFIPLLKMAMDKRINKFEKYMRDKEKRNGIRSKKQWTEEFRKWAIKHSELETEILKYLDS